MKQFEIIRKDLAPLQFKVFGILIFIAVNFKILTFSFYDVNPLVFIICMLIAFAIWTAKDILIIDFENKQIKDGFKILGLRHTDKMRFSGFEKIFINSVSTVETFRPNTRSISIHHENYKAFLKTYEGDKYWIAVNSDKDRLIKRLKILNENLNTEIYDYTVPEQVKVD